MHALPRSDRDFQRNPSPRRANPSRRAERTVMALVSPARKPALNSLGMFSEPGTHLLIGPGPLEGMSVPMVVFWPRSQDMRLELLLTRPGRPFQVIVLERMDEDFRLVQPRRVGGRIPGSPPALIPSEIRSRVAGYVTGPAVLDQEDAA